MGKILIPTKLEHKPIVYVDYQEIDHTDAKFFSIGHASWDKKNDFSAKIFRKKNKKWSRQSEEIPLKRLLDLSLFLISKIYGEKGFDNEAYIKNEDIDSLNKYLATFKADSSIEKIFNILKKNLKKEGKNSFTQIVSKR